MLPGTDAPSAHRLAENMRQMVQGFGIKHPISPCGIVTLSIGVATLRIASVDVPGGRDELLGHADRTLYAAKASDRNAVCTYTP